MNDQNSKFKLNHNSELFDTATSRMIEQKQPEFEPFDPLKNPSTFCGLNSSTKFSSTAERQRKVKAKNSVLVSSRCTSPPDSAFRQTHTSALDESRVETPPVIDVRGVAVQKPSSSFMSTRNRSQMRASRLLKDVQNPNLVSDRDLPKINEVNFMRQSLTQFGSRNKQYLSSLK